jgi:3-hydroxyisobutyrate dehydrogenase-like beta-hydroxyacid dehydrogenase
MTAIDTIRTVGIVSPGAMGSALGRCWAAGGARVIATTAGRSTRTAGLAHGLELLPSLAEVVAASDLVVSIVPPGAAIQTAAAIATAAQAGGVQPLVLDLNAISPRTLEEVRLCLASSGCELADGAISGAPPRPGNEPTMYLAGSSAAVIASRELPGVQVRVVSTELGDASAVKMCTASVYKGFSALLAQALLTAEHHGVTEIVLTDLTASYGDQLANVARQLSVAASKAHRFVAEMEQIAQTQAGAGAVGELFGSMAAVYQAISGSELAKLSPESADAPHELTAVLAELRARS